MDLIPVIDPERLQAAINEAAFKGAVNAATEFYSGYNSPFQKQVREELEAKGVNFSFQLPDVVAMINTSLSAEVDRIANNAIAATYLPLVREVLVRNPNTVINFSDILQKLVQENSHHDRDEFSCDVEQSDYSWLNVKIQRGREAYSFALHTHYKDGKDIKDEYQLLSLPTLSSRESLKMTIYMEDMGKVEMPFLPHLLTDRFVAYLANLVLNKTVIVMDQDTFNYDWFETCHCH